MKKTILALTILLLLPMSSNADVTTVTFDHSKDKSNIQRIDVAEGSYFEVDIINTCADKFEVKSTGLEIKKGETKKEEKLKLAEPGAKKGKTKGYNMENYISDNKCECEIDEQPVILKIPHDPKYGGYRIDIVRKDKKDSPMTALQYNAGQSKQIIDDKLSDIYNSKSSGESDEDIKKQQSS